MKPRALPTSTLTYTWVATLETIDRQGTRHEQVDIYNQPDILSATKMATEAFSRKLPKSSCKILAIFRKG